METVIKDSDAKEAAIILHDGQVLSADEARFICRTFGVADGATLNGSWVELTHADIEDGDLFQASVSAFGVCLNMDAAEDNRVCLPIAGLKSHADPTGWVAIRGQE